MVKLDGATLLKRLPQSRGRLEANAPLAGLTWFRVGGPAEVLFTPADESDLADFLGRTPTDIPVYVIGVGSNLSAQLAMKIEPLRLSRGLDAIATEHARDFVDILAL